MQSSADKLLHAALLRRVFANSPWVTISVLAHVVVIAIASVVYFVHGGAADESVPLDVAITASAATPPDVPLPKVVDREQVPQIADTDLEPNMEPVSDVPNTNDDDSPSDLGDDAPAQLPMPNTAIAPNGPGYRGALAPMATSGRGLPIKYGGRGIGKGGHGPESGPAPDPNLAAALDWLKRHQDEDGHWDCANFMKHDAVGEPCTGAGNPVNDVGVTGLAMLAFLGNGNTMRDGRHRKVVRSAVRWLQDQQRGDGLIGMPNSEGYMYSHAIATLAMCEAYGLSAYPPLKTPAQNAINFIATARNPYGVWRYQPRGGDGDTSITGWMVQALISGKEFGLQVDAAAFTASLAWFDSVTDPATGAAGYTQRGEGSSRPHALIDRFPASKTEAMTAVALLCRCLLHQEPKDTPVMSLAADTLSKKPPEYNAANGSIDMYYWYYGGFAMFQMGGPQWQLWNKKLSQAVLGSQCKDGNRAGSWDPADAWAADGGRVYATSMMALCLQASFRYSRVLGGRN